MSDADWDAEDFEPIKVTTAQPADKWDGEDEDDDVKDNWDDEDEDPEQTTGVPKPSVKTKKSLKEKIAEKEAKRKLEIEAKRREEEEASKKMTPEEVAEEKLRQQKLQEDADLELAMDAFGVEEESSSQGLIDSFSPSSSEEFLKFGEILKDKITQYEKSPHYVSFLETLFRDISTSLESEDLKKLGSSLNAMSNEKAKALKTSKGKKKKAAAKLNAGRDDNYDDYTVSGFDEFDDFI